MKGRVAILAFAALSLAGCAEEACIHYETKYRDEALSRQLAKDGVRHSLHPERGVCLPQSRRPLLEAASREVDTYFHEVAELLRDECEERAFVAWAARENLRYDVVSTRSSTGKPGRMLLIRSFSREEAKANLDKLRNEAPKDARCAG